MMNPLTTAGAMVQIADSVLAEAHEKLIRFMVVIIVLIAAMWAINAGGMMTMNWLFFFLGGAVIVIALTAPRKVLAAVGVGIAITGIAPTREAIMKGSLVGLKGLYTLILGTLLYFWMVAGFLATWSFQANPFAFVPFAGGILMLVVLSAYFNKKSEKMTILMVTVYALFIILSALWSTQVENVKGVFSGNSEATPGTAEVTDEQFIGEAHGETYVIRDDKWSVFTWTDGYCLRQFGGSGLLERGNDRRNTYSFLSPKSNQTIEVKLVAAGESWHGDVCQ